MDWMFKGKPALAVPEGKIGFVYITRYTDGSYYIGKKLCRSMRRKKPTKAQLAIRKNYVRKEMTEHKWQEYEGSAELKDSYTLENKEILAWCNTQQGMTFIEADLQIRNNVLFDEKCLNMNILGKFFPNVLDGEVPDDED